ncbi:type IV pilus twitching motility protein PilT [Saccharibacillus sp. JS10]|uniref:type IV pilus twitching motility protein PilT n=1 Tax=Saccharibacillus sp. JS10 TaxID=2950552 RepID=UPI00210BDE13|nr:type IV pilus twitching motility protein PilT [Saccharibacillus sp. JS10]MCQ4088773.1 type IV pilus twitching motility protein PilT [Saccharibacillus sp. JS10]
MNEPTRTIEELLRQMHAKGASDLHIAVGAPPSVRVHGSLMPLSDESVTPVEAEKMANDLLGEERSRAFRTEGELDFAYALPGADRFRINVYRQKGYAAISARSIPEKIPTMDQLGLPESLATLAHRPQGLILVTGPTGSGKSSTLAAMIQDVNSKSSKHIVTLEDPIEFMHEHRKSLVHQREVGLDTASFADGLRAALRQDPDVILVGEMRDLATISAAITAAETGHLVLATLHTTDAPKTIDRIIDAFPGDQQPQVRTQLASVLTAVISQRLLPNRGGQGRTCVTEVLINTPAVANLIRSEKIHQIRSVMQTGKAHGMHTLEMNIREQLQRGQVDPIAAKEYMTEVTA